MSLYDELTRVGTPDTSSPYGFTIADPAQREQIAATIGRQDGRAMVDWDQSNRERDAARLNIMKAASGLDPELQAMVMQRLGFQLPQQQLSFDGMSPTQAWLIQQGYMQHPQAAMGGGLMGKEGRTLQRQMQLEAYKRELGSDERERKLADVEARTKSLIENRRREADLEGQNLDLRQKNFELATRAEDRRAATSRMPSIPIKQAQAVIESMALAGRPAQEIQAAAEAMGYGMSSQSYRKGGLLGMGGSNVPVIGPRAYAPQGAPQPPAVPGAGAPGGVKLTREVKAAFLQAAGGNIEQAKKMAAEMGYTE